MCVCVRIYIYIIYIPIHVVPVVKFINASLHTMTLEDQRGQLLLNSMRPVRSTTKCSFATSSVIAFEVCACIHFAFPRTAYAALRVGHEI